jgi:hypothetical protein
VDWGGLDWTGRFAWGVSLEGEERVRLRKSNDGIRHDRPGLPHFIRQDTNLNKTKSTFVRYTETTQHDTLATPLHSCRSFSSPLPPLLKCQVLRSPQSIHSPTFIKSNPSPHSIEQQFVSFHLKFLILSALIAQLVERVTSTY